jgi:hypothetical protein
MLPATLPETLIWFPSMSPLTRAPATMMTSPVILTLPSTRPWISSEPEPLTLPRTTVLELMTDGSLIEPTSHVHVDVALEGGTVRNGQSSGAYVTNESSASL